MRVMLANAIASRRASICRRAESESGFAMVAVLGVLVVTSLLIAAIFLAVTADVQQTQRDTDQQRAYYAARSGENAFLYQLNQNPSFWSTCANDYQPTPVAVPGNGTGVKYSYVPVYNAGYSNATCTTANAISALIDPNSGTLRMAFTGYSGATNSSGVPKVTKTIVASFRKPSPLDFLWYTDHEMKDPVLDSTNCTGEKYYWQYTTIPSAIASNCEINWASGDHIYGPMYTNDQYLVYTNANPIFGRAGYSNDKIESSAAVSSVCVKSQCYSATFPGGGPLPAAPYVPLPQSVSSTDLLADATAYGQVYTGTTTINLSGGGATISNCPGSTSAAACTTGWLNTSVTSYPPIIYVGSAAGCPSSYTPSTSYSTNASGQYYGPCGDVYVHGTYSAPLTIVSDHDIIVVANQSTADCYTPVPTCSANPGLTTSADGSGNPTGNATLGLVAGDFVRVMHPGTGTTAVTTPQPVTIDAAILTLSHSFMVDNFTIGSNTPQPYLSVHGAIAQRYRGAVGQVGSTGYLKDYHYDDRLHVLLPPYLFSLSTAGWVVSRETLCMTTPAATDPSSCAYTGP
jgi:hypothetical protein